MVAKYDRIAAELRECIGAGAYTETHRLPAEDSLAATHGVSLATIRKSLDVLEAEGLIERHHGTGTFVKPKRQRLTRTTSRYHWEKDRVLLPDEERRRTGATEHDSGLELADLAFKADYAEVPAPAELARLFGIDEGATLLRRVYRTSKSDERAPLGVGTSYLVKDVIAVNPDLLDASNEPWPGGTLHQLWTVGIEVVRIVDTVTARPASAQEAELLDVRPGAPLLALRKLSIDTNARVVEVADIVWPGDRLEMTYTTELERWS
ncbi:MAG: GntR family transcriptional regulator [Rubrobacteraceae bacterium]|nr:GntR family transcriptional regulator [Rubrobacteraceae bacterium]